MFQTRAEAHSHLAQRSRCGAGSTYQKVSLAVKRAISYVEAACLPSRSMYHYGDVPAYQSTAYRTVQPYRLPEPIIVQATGDHQGGSWPCTMLSMQTGAKQRPENASHIPQTAVSLVLAPRPTSLPPVFLWLQPCCLLSSTIVQVNTAQYGSSPD